MNKYFSILTPQTEQHSKGDDRILSIFEYTLAILLLLIPIFNVLMLILWLFIPRYNKNLRRFAPAFFLALITTVVLYAVVILLVLIKIVGYVI